jgi:hypothetical protein
MKSDRRRNMTWEDIEAWHPWFAWYPVRVPDGEGFHKMVWWEWIEKRTRYLKTLDFGPLPTEYRFP